MDVSALDGGHAEGEEDGWVAADESEERHAEHEELDAAHHARKHPVRFGEALVDLAGAVREVRARVAPRSTAAHSCSGRFPVPSATS